MSLETWEMVQKVTLQNAEMQLALQCAPLIAGLKPSNLLKIQEEYYEQVVQIMEGSDITIYPLLMTQHKMVLLLYRKQALEAYLTEQPVLKLLKENGYQDLRLKEVLFRFRQRYQTYMQLKDHFPHEMGLLLGYPAGDVEGFIKNGGRHALCGGYWKVYENQALKLQLFKTFEQAKESLVEAIAKGTGLRQILQAV